MAEKKLANESAVASNTALLATANGNSTAQMMTSPTAGNHSSGGNQNGDQRKGKKWQKNKHRWNNGNFGNNFRTPAPSAGPWFCFSGPPAAWSQNWGGVWRDLT
ncbi:hypothetical protein GUJ93_ZPchr0007g4162 [Zizania palustris]|uniref:Uncharacterized protein n=1 Tax=Zizania palustris TaxID=103762 RepID=A0A8J5T358_ZIZPA|nr:hypothetical protein GUJ93_ZPchr0007g4162 [Zizania palustris]